MLDVDLPPRRHGRRRLGRRFLRALLRAALAVQHVVARDLVLARAHQRELDLVLHVLDVDRAAARDVARQRADDLRRELLDLLAHARAFRRGAAIHGQEGLGHGDVDLGRIETRDLAVAPDHLEGAGRRRGDFRRLGGLGNRGQAQGLGSGGVGVHGCLLRPEQKLAISPLFATAFSEVPEVVQGDSWSLQTTIYWAVTGSQPTTGMCLTGRGSCG
jgi:hypothetical protein